MAPHLVSSLGWMWGTEAQHLTFKLTWPLDFYGFFSCPWWLWGRFPGREGSLPKQLLGGRKGGKKSGLCSHDSVLPSALSQDVFSDPEFPPSRASFMYLRGPEWKQRKGHKGNSRNWSFRFTQKSKTISMTEQHTLMLPIRKSVLKNSAELLCGSGASISSSN